VFVAPGCDVLRIKEGPRVATGTKLAQCSSVSTMD
jgi:hypothetical protein